MSIQSEITRIQNEVSTQNGLIGQVSAKLQEKGATVTNTAGSSVTIANNTTKLQDVLAMAATIPEGVELPELTTPATAADLRSGKELIDAEGNKITGTMPDSTQGTISISVNTSGRVTASLTQTAGYVAEDTLRGATQLSTQAAKTVTPTKSSQTAVAKGRYTTGAVTVAAIPAQYITTTDATATAADMRSGKTGYVNGSKVTGSIADFDGSYECSGESSGGGSGGAGIETCSVEITAIDNFYIGMCSYIGYENDAFVVKATRYTTTQTTNISLSGVVCGTSIVLTSSAYETVVDGGVTLVLSHSGTWVFYAPTAQGATATIILQSD
jgi:hypothetical protein